MSRAPLIGIGAMFVALVCVSAVWAAEVSRAEYKSAVEPICLQNVKANERIFANVRQEVNRGKLKLAASQFVKAADALRETIAELRVVPRPVADRALLGRWLTEAGQLARTFGVAARELRAGNEHKVVVETAHMVDVAEAANRLVFAFEFRYCRLEPSRFT
jgi:hypothetical protein